ncbi:MATH domain and coiled-coil domain-containing protein At3g58370-like isoform X2 [Corylus avellana]|uniref:MATH domain and coiled-coil domain-containing protein At3g58370-like isoform X2 n=1 Tax=Corylus avellana TaxID=13451 RepID=UPI00286B817B|nr:MATH domain and coiled-coil domain-containing protein At3g58370-like isoform X2 [Corylus avellana]
MNFITLEHFTVEGRRWQLKLYPKGEGKGADTSLSLYLRLDDSEILPPNRKLYAKGKLRIRDQINNNHLENTVEHWFSNPGIGYGFSNLLSLRELHDTSKDYLVGDVLFVECKIVVISVVKNFSSN